MTKVIARQRSIMENARKGLVNLNFPPEEKQKMSKTALLRKQEFVLPPMARPTRSLPRFSGMYARVRVSGLVP